DVSILVRPHPGHKLLDDSPGAAALEALSGVVIHPLERSHPTIPEALPEYYDTIHHAAAVIGVNTSAMIDSAMVGRGVYVLLAERDISAVTRAPGPPDDELRAAAARLENLFRIPRSWRISSTS